MEENVKTKKDRRPLIAMFLVMFLCCGIFLGLVFSGVLPLKTQIGYTDINTAKLVKHAQQVSDEKTLRELLLLKTTLDICVVEDIEIDETFVVNGDKTLYGDVVISADLAGQFRQMYLFDVQMGASLTIDGITLDGHGTADGIQVQQTAKLNFRSGTVQYMRNGIRTNGEFNMDGGLIQHCSQIAIYAAFKSDVHLNEGLCYNSSEHALYLEKLSYAEIHEGMKISTCRGYAVYNLGDLNVYGGKVSDTMSAAFVTENGLHMEYKGKKADGKIELENIGTIGIRVDGKKDVYVSDVTAVNVGTNVVYNTSDSTGKLTVEDCYFENVGVLNSNGMSIAGKTKVHNVTIVKANNGGINFRENSEFDVKNLTIKDVTGAGMTVTGTLNGENINVSECTIHNLLCGKGADVNIVDGVFEISKRTNIFMQQESSVSLENVEVQGVKDEELFSIHVSKDCDLTLKGNTSVTGATKSGICLYENAKLTMEDGKIFNINSTTSGAAVWVREPGAVFNMKGGSIIGNFSEGSSGAVFVADKTTFNMYGGTISQNKSTLSGGAIQVQGVMNMYGGTISNNHAQTSGGGINVGNIRSSNVYGTLNIFNGNISNNTADTTGGGINISGDTTCKISGGTIKGNNAVGIGDGICDNGKLTVSGKTYITNNEIELGSKEIVLKIAGSTLSRHSRKDPLHVIPNGITVNGDNVIECDNDSAAKSLVNDYVASGTSAYTLVQNKNNITVDVNAADMNVAGAETVYVTTFKELKEAVETTESKRIIVIGADIEWESVVQVPLGVTVMVRDDGHTRTLSRAEGNKSRFFQTYCGSGFILEATEKGKLIIDGTANAELSGSVVNLFMRGDTNVSGVVFKNNGFANASGGGFFNQIYGTAKISHSTFENGMAFNGGAINQTGGALIIEACEFKNNESSNYGGAIASTGGSVTVKDSSFVSNKTVANGGALYTFAKTADIVNCSWIDNSAYRGGAIYNGNNCDITLVATKEHSFKNNNAVSQKVSEKDTRGGAICVGSGTLTIEGYSFIENASTNTGGAIHFNKNDSIVAQIKNCSFTKNQSGNLGGAIYNGSANKKNGVTIQNSDFVNNAAATNGGAVYVDGAITNIKDGTFTGNEAVGGGGALYNGASGTTNLTGTGTFTMNRAKSEMAEKNYGGGAICVGTGTLNIDGYRFEQNVSVSNTGGAIKLNSINIEATIKNCEFENNTTTGIAGDVQGGGAIMAIMKSLNVEGSTFTNNVTGGRGGAIHADTGDLTVTSCTFGGENAGNQAYRGGAIFGSTSADITLHTSADYTTKPLFANNQAVAPNNNTEARGGAIAVASGSLTISGYDFNGNESDNDGGAIHIATTSAPLKVGDSNFAGNKATNYGGAIFSNSTNTEKGLDIRTTTYLENTSKDGGAIYLAENNTAPFMVTGCRFEGNSATGMGGAIRLNNANLEATIKNCEFDGNTTTETPATGAGGGAIMAVMKSLNVEGSTFTNNVTSGLGGAIEAEKGDLTVTSCTFGGENAGNQAYRGGAIYAGVSADVILNTSADYETAPLFANNHAVAQGNNTDARGGAIAIGSGSLTISGYAFNGNESANEGGAIHIATTPAPLEINDSNFAGNKAKNYGGAIFSNSTNTEKGLDIRTTTYSENESKSGGAIYLAINNTAPLKATGCTFESNKSTEQAGAIFVHGGIMNGETITFKENMSGTNGGAVYVDGTTANIKDGIFTGNEATGGGGAIYNGASGTTNLTGTGSFTMNKAKSEMAEKNYGGGAICVGTGTLNIDGYRFEQNVSVSNSGGAIKLNNANIEATIKNCEFNNNTTTGIAGDVQGGGAIMAIMKSLNVEGSTFTNNVTDGRGGAIHVDTGDLTVTSCTFGGENAGNQAYRGGAILGSTNADITLNTSADYTTKPLFANNHAVAQGNNTDARGGAIAVASGSLTINGYAFNGNESANEGGAIHIATTGAPLEIAGSNFAGNKATNCGGAIFSNSTNTAKGIDIRTTTFSGNETKNGGAIYLAANNTAPLKVTGCIFEGNKATNQGGAIYLYKKAIATTIENTTFNNNSSGQQGGAIYDDSTDTTKGLHIVGSKFEGNSSGAAGGAINSNNTSLVQIETTEFKANHSNSTSGAIKVNAGNMTVTDCNFTGNYAVKSGGVMEATGNAGTIIFQVTEGKEGQYGFYNNYTTTEWGGVFKTNVMTKLTVTRYEFSGNESKAYNEGEVIYTGSSTTAGEVILNSCTPLNDSDIKSDVTGAVVQQ